MDYTFWIFLCVFILTVIYFVESNRKDQRYLIDKNIEQADRLVKEMKDWYLPPNLRYLKPPTTTVTMNNAVAPEKDVKLRDPKDVLDDGITAEYDKDRKEAEVEKQAMAALGFIQERVDDGEIAYFKKEE
jgi:hypothetical protein